MFTWEEELPLEQKGKETWTTEQKGSRGNVCTQTLQESTRRKPRETRAELVSSWKAQIVFPHSHFCTF